MERSEVNCLLCSPEERPLYGTGGDARKAEDAEDLRCLTPGFHNLGVKTTCEGLAHKFLEGTTKIGGTTNEEKE